MSNYPPGAKDDPRAPYNEPLNIYKKVKVDVDITLGTLVDVEVLCDEHGYPEVEHLHETVKQVLKDKYKVDQTTTVHDINIWDWKYK